MFWGLDANLAYARHFPAINWLTSYSLYIDRLSKWFADNVNKEFPELRSETMKLLQEEAELQEIVQLVGVDALSFQDQFKLEACKSIREDYLHQNAFHEIDTYASTNKQYKMLKLILEYYRQGSEAIDKGADYNKVVSMPFESIGRFKYVEESEVDKQFEVLMEELRKGIQELISQGGEQDD